MSELETKFLKMIRAANETAKRECGYNPSGFNKMLADHGALGTAQRLLATSEPSEGFTRLWLCKRLDLTLEAFVIKKEFQPLFTADEIKIAKVKSHRKR